MVPNIGQTNQDPAVEVGLARTAASQLAASLPHKSPQQIVEDLLARLQKRRARRERKGANHWEAYCPRYLEKVVSRFQVGEPLRQIVRFIVVNHSSAVEFARRIARDSDLAEEAVSQTYIELLRGRTTVPLFYRALKMNTRNLLARRATELRRAESLDGFLSAAGARRAQSAEESIREGSEEIDFPSHRLEDQDPLDILIARQEQAELSDELEYAIRVVRYPGNRETLKRKWWKKSAIGQLEKRIHGRISRGRGNRKCGDTAPQPPARAVFGG